MIVLQVRGGLGNQMFQYAAIRSYALQNNIKKVCLYTECFENDVLRDFSLDNLQLSDEIDIVEKSFWLNTYRKVWRRIKMLLKCQEGNASDTLKLFRFGFFEYLKNSEYLAIPSKKLPLMYFSSVFMDTKYWGQYAELIKKELRVKTLPTKENEAWIQAIQQEKDSVCVHIRRGDYVNNAKYMVCDNKYYEKAVQECRERLDNPKFFVFSEDIEYAKTLNLGEQVFYVDLNNPDYEELRLMYQCRNFIISNSTFSWWAQCLAEERNLVISPSKWKNDEVSPSPLIEEDWILMDV